MTTIEVTSFPSRKRRPDANCCHPNTQARRGLRRVAPFGDAPDDATVDYVTPSRTLEGTSN
jgi:hypothetical protein